MLANKDRCIALVDGRAQEVPVSVVQQDESCLNPAQIQELVGLGWRLERELGAPQDIEWTVCDEQIIIAPNAAHYPSHSAGTPIALGQFKHHRELLWPNQSNDL